MVAISSIDLVINPDFLFSIIHLGPGASIAITLPQEWPFQIFHWD